MVIRSSFFNSVNNDRVYDSAVFAEYFASFVGNGVFGQNSNNLQVLQNTGLSVVVKPGKGWINGYYVTNDSDFIIQNQPADNSLPRVDRIVMGLSLSTRAISIYYKTGTPSVNPQPPALIRNGIVHELALADVRMRQGASTIIQSDITDTRPNNALCGFVTGVINQVDTSTLFAQYERQFNDFFQSAQDTLSGDVAGNLAVRINNTDNALSAHANNDDIHVTTNQKNNWNQAIVDIGNKTQLATQNKVNLVSAVNELRALSDTKTNLRLNFREMLKVPEGFSFPLPLKITKDGFGEFKVNDLDLEDMHPLRKSDGKTYYVGKGGNNANDGLTPQTRFLDLNFAFARPDVDTIMLMAGDYGRQYIYTQNLPDRNIKIKAYGGKVIVGCYEDPLTGNPWTLHSPGVYTFVRSAVTGVYDTRILNSYGNYSRYQKLNSIAEVQATPGSWFNATDGSLYVRTLDGRQPSSNQDIKVAVSGYTIASTRNKSYYIEGIEFQFGTDALKLSNSKLNLLNRCGFNYAQTINGLSIVDSEMTVSKDCLSYENFADGFNYHADNWTTRQAYALEINNTGYRNGFTGATVPNNNGSTAHVNCVMVRVNGLYFENFGPNCADVGPRQSTWNIGVTCYNSRQTPTPIDFLTENLLWLESCYAYGSTISLYSQIETAQLYVRNTQWLGSTFFRNSSLPIEYTQ